MKPIKKPRAIIVRFILTTEQKKILLREARALRNKRIGLREALLEYGLSLLC